MTLKEAIESGQPFRRPIWRKGIYATIDLSETFSTQEIISEDWEIKEDEISITRSRYLSAVADTLKEMRGDDFLQFENSWKTLMEKLGL